jgi:hypothetical protein
MSGIYSSLTGPRSLSDVRGGASKIGKGEYNLLGDKQQALEKKKEKEVEGEGSDGWDGVIRRVVIGVPANCSEKKKEATRRAARSAGFEEVAVLMSTDHKICTSCVCYSYYVCSCVGYYSATEPGSILTLSLPRLSCL